MVINGYLKRFDLNFYAAKIKVLCLLRHIFNCEDFGFKGRYQKHPEGGGSLIFRRGTDHIHHF